MQEEANLLSVSTLFLSNLGCKFFKKRAIVSSLHSTGHTWAPPVASAAAQTWWDGQELQPLGTHHSCWHRGGCATPADTREDASPGSAPMSILPSTCCRSSCLHGQPSSPSTGAPGWYLGTRRGKQLVKSFNFYDTKTANRVKGIGKTGPKIKQHITDSKQSSLWMQNCYLYSNQYYYFLA